MKDELVRRASHLVLLCVALAFAGCNGCGGCGASEGQTPETTPSEALVNTAEPSAAVAATNAPAAAPAAVATSDTTVQPNPEHDPTGVRRCCKTIKDNLEAAPEKHRATWKAALEKCNEVAEKKLGRKGLDAVREQLMQVGYPAECH